MEGYQIQNILEMLIASGATVSVVWIVARAFMQRKQIGTSDPHVLEAVGQLRDSVEAMREDVVEMTERLEFTERVLGQLADGERKRVQ